MVLNGKNNTTFNILLDSLCWLFGNICRLYAIIGYNDCCLFSENKSPGPQMNAKLNCQANYKIRFSIFEPFLMRLASKLAKNSNLDPLHYRLCTIKGIINTIFPHFYVKHFCRHLFPTLSMVQNQHQIHIFLMKILLKLTGVPFANAPKGSIKRKILFYRCKSE